MLCGKGLQLLCPLFLREHEEILGEPRILLTVLPCELARVVAHPVKDGIGVAVVHGDRHPCELGAIAVDRVRAEQNLADVRQVAREIPTILLEEILDVRFSRSACERIILSAVLAVPDVRHATEIIQLQVAIVCVTIVIHDEIEDRPARTAVIDDEVHATQSRAVAVDGRRRKGRVIDVFDEFRECPVLVVHQFLDVRVRRLARERVILGSVSCFPDITRLGEIIRLNVAIVCVTVVVHDEIDDCRRVRAAIYGIKHAAQRRVEAIDLGRLEQRLVDACDERDEIPIVFFHEQLDEHVCGMTGELVIPDSIAVDPQVRRVLEVICPEFSEECQVSVFDTLANLIDDRMQVFCRNALRQDRSVMLQNGTYLVFERDGLFSQESHDAYDG